MILYLSIRFAHSERQETKLKFGNETIYVWSAIDVESKECLGIYISKTRSSLDTILFVRSILKFCSNKPKILVDGIHDHYRD
ncbi:protein of unknown function [Methanocaldococcus lauensis]|uniref:DDE domain-containing protein n=1 Tax=Methanocaldococcus lauensis TaxID=2546128 RepID=A0A8D6PNV4_9EURY|nr:protein of unknown function [Methanocaldococcus lauensis]